MYMNHAIFEDFDWLRR